jgi:predicted outer membrane protein
MIIPPSCAILGGLGGGPLAILESTCAGPDFDRLYIENMYQVQTDISALTTQGIEQTTDKGLRNLSVKIRNEQSDQNTKLAMWYRDMGLGRIKVDYCKSANIINCLTNVCGVGFDPVYAQTLSDTLKSLRASALVSAPKLSRDDMKRQAELVAKTAQNEINVLQKWISIHGNVPEK